MGKDKKQEKIKENKKNNREEYKERIQREYG